MKHHLQRDIEKLKRILLNLSALAEESVQLSVTAVVERDQQLAQRVIQGDIAIDHMEVEIEEECLKILALHQPVASDLRFIVAVLKINNDLERIGDQGVNIAERAAFLASHAHMAIPLDFQGMAGKSRQMLHKSLEALINTDTELAREVRASDDEVDNMKRDIHNRLYEYIRKDPTHIDILISYMNIARHLERIADLATNIAEDVIYLVEGDIVRHKSTM